MNNPQNMAVMTGAQAQTVQGEKTFDDLKSHSGSTVNFDAGSLSLNNPSAVFAEGVHGLVPAPAAGDIAAGRVLGADGGWVTSGGGGLPPFALAYHSSSVEVPSHSGYFYLPLGATARQRGGVVHTPANGRITVSSNGIYLINGSAVFEQNNTGARSIYAMVNQAGYVGRVVQWNVGGVGSYTDAVVQFSCMADLSAGQYIEIGAHQTSGQTLNISEIKLSVLLLTAY